MYRFFVIKTVLFLFLIGTGVYSISAQKRDTLYLEGINVDLRCSTTGTVINRSNSPSPTLLVYGQVGCTGDSSGWLPQSGQVCYRFKTNFDGTMPPVVRIYYSKYSDETTVRLTLDDQIRYFTPTDQGDWNKFSDVKVTYKKPLIKGEHVLNLFTEGQHYGVMDIARIQVIY